MCHKHLAILNISLALSHRMLMSKPSPKPSKKLCIFVRVQISCKHFHDFIMTLSNIPSIKIVNMSIFLIYGCPMTSPQSVSPQPWHMMVAHLRLRPISVSSCTSSAAWKVSWKPKFGCPNWALSESIWELPPKK